MDSLSQVILGAAVGEVVLGKKLGNKAMLWGAVGGTIPDLDVLFDPVLTELQALAFHRGFTHSILFAFLGGLGFGYLFFKYYRRQYTRQKILQQITLKESVLLFFWAFITHIALDCFTMYGTQVFSPFSNYRLAFSTIAVADLFYTVPFLFCLVVAMFMKKGTLKRKRWNYAGIIISCLYLLFTVCNKSFIAKKYKYALDQSGLKYEKAILGPTIMTNFLWNMTIDSGDKYYHGQYSMFDSSPIKFKSINKNHKVLDESGDDDTINTLKWFTHGFYNVVRKQNGKLQFNDLRYGTFSGQGKGEDDYIFRFEIEKMANGKYHMSKVDGGPPPGERKNMMSRLYDRIKGN